MTTGEDIENWSFSSLQDVVERYTESVKSGRRGQTEKNYEVNKDLSSGPRRLDER